MPRDDAVVLDMIAACQRVARFVDGHTRETFLSDDQLQSAVLYQLTLLGEAVARLTDELKAAWPDVPWADIRGMRNIVIHEYHRVDLEEAWRTAYRDVPSLCQQLEAVRDGSSR